MLNIEKLKASHRKFEKAQTEIVSVAAEYAGQDALDYARENTGYRNRTGKLTESNGYKVVRVGGRVARVRVMNRQKYAMAIDKGSPPHRIVAKRAPYLVFYWAKMSRWMRVRSVNHPGNKPYKFLRNATDHAFGEFVDRMRRDIAEAAKKF
jgi:hypothetical protein